MIPDTYALEALRILLPEFDFTDTKEVDLKIEEHLKRKKFGKLEPVMIDALREFKNTVQAELLQASKSSYFTHAHGQYCDVRDFDLQRLAADMAAKFPSISREVMEHFLSNATFYYYLK